MVRHYLLFSLLIVSFISLANCTNKDKNTTTNNSEHIKKASFNQNIHKASQEQNRVDVYYFHRNKRCHGCVTLEKMMHKALDSLFTDEIASGIVNVKIINVEEDENKKLISKYDVVSNGIMIDLVKDGNSISLKHLVKVWQLKHDALLFNDYVKTQIENALKEVRK